MNPLRCRPASSVMSAAPAGPAPALPSHHAALSLLLMMLPGLLLAPASTRGATPEFERDIEPILVKRCSECHGPDKQKSGLRLDLKSSAFKGGKSGKPAIVPGDSKASEVLARVTTTDPDDRMPPKGERLGDEDVARLRSWIDQGAIWPDKSSAVHWSFSPPKRPVIPAPKRTERARNTVDRFILARLEEEGLAPAPEADRHTLCRRLYLDLTGLPPRWADVQAFVNDPAPDAYEKLVDRLLASPHYGEHIARGWLDLARYADSNGYQVDLTRSMWPYRDWVIKAFNQNMPFDQFTIEQLAGDLLPHATVDQKIATGFSRNTKINDEGGGDAEEYRTKAVKDRVATVATTWLGLTMNCCECHTHKYDPLTQEDYYRLYAVFNSSSDGGNYNVAPTLDVPAPDRSRMMLHLQQRIDGLKERRKELEKSLPAEQAAWEKRMRHRTNVWQVLSITNAISTGGSSYTNLPDGSILAGGVNPIYDTIVLEAATRLSGITAILLEVLPDPSLPKKGPGRWDKSGNFILDEFAAWTVPTDPPSGSPADTAGTNLVFARAFADWEQPYYRAEHAIDRNPKTGWAIGPKFGEAHFLIAELKQPTRATGGARLGFRFDHYHGSSHTIGRMRLSLTSEKDPLAWWPVPPEIAVILAAPTSRRTEKQRLQLAAHYRTVSAPWRELERDLGQLEERLAGIRKAHHSTLVMQEREKPRESFMQVRGNFLERGKKVSPGIPAVFQAEDPARDTDRLGLARWLVTPGNPLTARVTVNRLWERLFGIGLVKTSEDFGRQGEAPSHPALLDWLACEFMQPGADDPTARPWDLKRMQKLFVMSAAYRQDAAVSPELLRRDPYNRLLARGPRFRLDAEMIRDQALRVSGLLNDDVGGPSVYPVQVANLWKEIGFLRPEIGMDEWPVSEGPDLYRRAVYTFWRRVCTYPLFATFDAPSRDLCLARRSRSNTPLQALAGLNEVTLLECARVFAQRILAEGGRTATARVEFAVRETLGRPPTSAERDRLVAFYEQERAGFRRDPDAAQALVRNGAAPRPSDLDARELAAWVMVANVLFNLDEMLSKG